MKSKLAQLSVSLSSALVALAISTVPARAAVVGDYRFQDVLTSSVGPATTLSLVDPMQGTFMDSNVLGQMQRVLNFGVSNDHGVKVNTLSFLSATTYSIVLLASFNLSPPPMGSIAEKLFDFKNLSSDNGVYVNSTSGLISFLGPTVLQVGGTPAVSGTYTQIVLTRDGATNQTTLYQDGVAAFQFVDTGNVAVLGDGVGGTGTFLAVFADDVTSTTDESLAGNIARLRLYNTVLTAAQVMALDTTAPIPEPTTWALLATGAFAIFAFRRRASAR